MDNVQKHNNCNDNIVEQVRKFNYLCCQMGRNRNLGMQNKLQKLNYMCGTIERSLVGTPRQETIQKFAPQSLLYGSECCNQLELLK
jgi:hypothetical protein